MVLCEKTKMLRYTCTFDILKILIIQSIAEGYSCIQASLEFIQKVPEIKMRYFDKNAHYTLNNGLDS